MGAAGTLYIKPFLIQGNSHTYTGVHTKKVMFRSKYNIINLIKITHVYYSLLWHTLKQRYRGGAKYTNLTSI